MRTEDSQWIESCYRWVGRTVVAGWFVLYPVQTGEGVGGGGKGKKGGRDVFKDKEDRQMTGGLVPIQGGWCCCCVGRMGHGIVELVAPGSRGWMRGTTHGAAEHMTRWARASAQRYTCWRMWLV